MGLASVVSARGFAALALSAFLAGCVGTSQPEGLFYRPPATTGQEFVATEAAPDEVARILRDAGLGRVRSDANSVTLVSSDLRLVDCGTLIQIAYGNRVEVPATAPDSVLIYGFITPGLIRREIESASTVRLTRLADGAGYDITEDHSVTRRYDAVASRARSKATISFDATSQGEFPNKAVCQSSGLIGTLLP